MASIACDRFSCEDGGLPVQEGRGKSQWKNWAIRLSITVALGAVVGVVGFLASPQTSAAGHAMAKDFRGGNVETGKEREFLGDEFVDLPVDGLACGVPDISYMSQVKKILGDAATVEQLKLKAEAMTKHLDDPEFQQRAKRTASEQIRMLRQPKNLAKLMKMLDDPDFVEVVVEPLVTDPKTQKELEKLMSDPEVDDQIIQLSSAMKDHISKNLEAQGYDSYKSVDVDQKLRKKTLPEFYAEEKHAATARLLAAAETGAPEPDHKAAKKKLRSVLPLFFMGGGCAHGVAPLRAQRPAVSGGPMMRGWRDEYAGDAFKGGKKQELKTAGSAFDQKLKEQNAEMNKQLTVISGVTIAGVFGSLAYFLAQQ